MAKSAERTAASEGSGARMEVRWLPVDALKPDAGKARVHRAKQVARIAGSIAAFGFKRRCDSRPRPARTGAGEPEPGEG
jgi:hypothetical protein